MEQILIYWWLFVGIIVSVIDETFEWLRPHGFSSSVFLFAIFTAGGFIAFNKWSVGVDLRLQAIETRLGIEHKARKVRKLTWWQPVFWLAIAAYLMGKSLGADGFGFFIGTAISGFVLLMCAFCTYCFIDQTIRDYWRKVNFSQRKIE